jgi:2-aminoethylphosphonate-pyruvate transaminase
MPFADGPATAHAWATERAVLLWVAFGGDLSAADLAALAAGWPAINADGGRLALVVPPGAQATPTERRLADLVVEDTPPAPPSPFGVFAAMAAAGIEDVRRVGVLAASADGLRAGANAGCGAAVGIAPAGTEARWPLLLAQPDHVVAAEAFAALDRQRFAANRAHRQRVLLNPGPSVTSDRVHRAVGGPDLCHREPEYAEILDGVRAKLLRIAGVGDDWAAATLAGSGTAALEAMVLSSVRPGRKLVVCRNGVYGDRAALIARRAGIELASVAADDLSPIDPEAVADALDAHPDTDAVFVVHHETTTGLLNPVHAIAAEANRRGVLVAVDAISSFGAEDLPLAGTGIDFVATTSNKCLHGLPGVAVVLVSPRGQARIAEVPPRSLYLDLGGYLKAQRSRSVPFTPAIPAVYGLDAALDELLDEGLDHRQELYSSRMAVVDRDLAKLGLEARVAPEHRSRCVRSVPLPPGLGYDELHDALKAEGYVVYAGLGDAAQSTFRVCALGALTVEGMEDFTAALGRVLAGRAVGAAA